MHRLRRRSRGLGVTAGVAVAIAVFHHQIIALEHNAGLAIVAATVTNAVTITVGTF